MHTKILNLEKPSTRGRFFWWYKNGIYIYPHRKFWIPGIFPRSVSISEQISSIRRERSSKNAGWESSKEDVWGENEMKYLEGGN